MERLGLAQVTDTAEIGVWVGEVLAAHPEPVAQFLEGKGKALGFLVGPGDEALRRSGRPAAGAEPATGITEPPPIGALLD